MAKTTGSGLEPFDRLEEKIKLLVSTIVAAQGRADPAGRRERPAAARARRAQGRGVADAETRRPR